MNAEEKISTVFFKEQKDSFLSMEINESIKWLGHYSIHMAKIIEMLRRYEKPNNDEVYLTQEALKRYKGLALSLSFPIENFKKYIPSTEQFKTVEEEKSAVEQGLLIQSWSSLGSLLESTLQMFLAFYHDDFLKSGWGKWDDKTINEIEHSLVEFNEKLKQIVAVNNVANNGGLNGKNRTSFYGQVKTFLQSKAVMPNLADITLSSLIDFYFTEEIFYKDGIYKKEELQQIRNYRNAIHSFKDRTIGTWEELNEYSKLVLLLIIEILERLPPLPNHVPIEAWYLEEETRFIMQQAKWFKFKVGFSK